MGVVTFIRQILKIGKEYIVFEIIVRGAFCVALLLRGKDIAFQLHLFFVFN